MELFCSNCGKPRDKGRRACLECYKLKKRQYCKGRYDAGIRVPSMYTVCLICGKQIRKQTIARADKQMCRSCYSSIKGSVTNTYVIAGGGGYHFLHRKIAEQTLGYKLSTNEVVHHLDGNVNHNELINLMVMSRHLHSKLHAYLKVQRVIIEKSMNESQENCWNNLIVPMTTAWLEMTNAKVIKLWEIGQSAAEPLSEQSYGERSETMYLGPYRSRYSPDYNRVL